MTNFQIILDTVMCCFWIATYTFVLIGTIKYKYPLISPTTQAITASFEFSAVYSSIINGFFSLNYGTFAYLYWTIIEIITIYIIIKMGYILKKRVPGYLMFVAIMTCLMCYFVGHLGQMFFFSYFNTIIGALFWFYHIFKKDYPMKPFALMAFISKFLADTVAIPVYFGRGPQLINFICIALPLLDFLFIISYFIIKRKRSTRS